MGGFAFKNEAILGDLESGGVWDVLRIIRSPGGDPVMEGAVVGAVCVEELATGVWHFAEGFEQEKAALR